MSEKRSWTPRRVVFAIGQLLVAAIVVYYVYRTIMGLLEGDAVKLLRFEWPLLLASVAMLGVYYVLYSHSMALIVRALGDPMSGRDAFELNYITALGKYVPGGVWHMVGRFALAPSMGVRRRNIVVSTVFENALGVVSGILVAVVGLGFGAVETLGIPVWLPVVIVLGMFAMMHPAIFGRIMALGMRLMKVEGEVPQLSTLQLIGQVAYRAFAWVVAGAAFLLYRNAIVIDPVNSLGLYAGAYAAASVAGLLILFAPGGIGVREAVLTALLTPAYGPVVAGTIGLSSRVWSTITELLMSGVAVLLSARRKGRAAEDVSDDA